jgi:hypothetical protein
VTTIARALSNAYMALFRSASLSSLASSSDDPFLFETPNPAAKRTRKRFTGSQLTMLEQLFHHTTHPSRDEREALARELNLYDFAFLFIYFLNPRFSLIIRPPSTREPKVVTIWFQNRRQNERKANLNSTTASVSASEPPSSSPAIPVRKPSRTSSTSTSTSHSRSHSHSHSSSPYAHAPKSLSRRPTLETMALRSELRTAPPRTPSKRLDPSKSPWDNMPSSPLAPPSPPEREFVQFAMGRRSKQARSLEWACAAARLVGSKHRGSGGGANDNDNDEDETDEEEDLHEAITPIGSLTGGGGRDVFWDARRTAAKSTDMENTKDPESELMDAALLLCGLGRKVA